MAYFSKKNPDTFSFSVKGRLLEYNRPALMGILNLTPDSFYDGGQHNDSLEKALAQAEKMLGEGADIIDIGGQSSRPGAENISAQEEQDRILPTIEALAKAHPDALISVDTFRAEVAKNALEAGAGMVNDISGGLLDETMASLVGEAKCPYILSHMRGTPEDMATLTNYTNLPAELFHFLHKQLETFKQAGCRDIVLDLGLGFAKTREQNWLLLRQIMYYKELGYPVLVGLSRKSMIWKTLGKTPGEALNGTTAAHAIALLQGANLLRVHDVKEAKEALDIVETYKAAAGEFGHQDFFH